MIWLDFIDLCLDSGATTSRYESRRTNETVWICGGRGTNHNLLLYNQSFKVHVLVIKGSDKERLKRHTRGFEIYLLGLAYKAYMLGLFYMESSKRSSTIFTKPKESKDARSRTHGPKSNLKCPWKWKLVANTYSIWIIVIEDIYGRQIHTKNIYLWLCVENIVKHHQTFYKMF